MGLPDNWDGWARFSASYTKTVKDVLKRRKKTKRVRKPKKK